jgi:malate dehydrogenase (oxaloacetate-decarboxylating)(NADP+)
MMGYDNKLIRRFVEVARCQPMRVVFGEANTDNILQAAVLAYNEGVCHPILLGNADIIRSRAEYLGLSLEGIEIVNPREHSERERRERYARLLAEKNGRKGFAYRDTYEKMYSRNWFGSMMVETGDADAFIAGTYFNDDTIPNIAKEVVGIRPGYRTFATLHIVDTKRGVMFLADTTINKRMDKESLIDITRLTKGAVEYYSFDPVIAMLSYSNFGAVKGEGCNAPSMVSEAVSALHERYPELCVDGEMQVDIALNKEKRDRTYPFNRLAGKEVNTLIFPSLDAATAAYEMILNMGCGEGIGPIQMGLNKPVHFISVEAPVREIFNLATIASIDAAVAMQDGVCRL